MIEPVVALLEGSSAAHASLAARDVPLSAAFRQACAKNACGFYERCWMCPPDAGTIDVLMDRVRSFSDALAFRKAYPLTDSFDIEGMHFAARSFNRLARQARSLYGGACLVLGAGACGACERCAKLDQEPCRTPGDALGSLESHGVDVSALARVCDLPYLSKGAVVYFGLLLYNGGIE